MTRRLVDGINHVALVTRDLERLTGFFRDVFGAEVLTELEAEGRIRRHCLLQVGERAALHLMEAPDAELPEGPMFSRGRLDHLGLSVADEVSLHSARERLVDVGQSAGEINDLGAVLSVHFRDPDGTEGEVCWLKQPFPADA